MHAYKQIDWRSALGSLGSLGSLGYSVHCVESTFMHPLFLVIRFSGVDTRTKSFLTVTTQIC